MRRYHLLALAGMLLLALSGDVPAAPTAGLLPDPVLTPGAVRTTDVKDICTTKTGTIRHTTKAMKDRVRAEYAGKPGFAHVDSKTVELDHLIPLTIGGADRVENLWPQAWDGPWGAHVKDKLENDLHRRICAGKITPEEAQREVARDWIALYRRLGLKPSAS